MLSCLQGLHQELNTLVHIGRHVGMLGQIVHNRVQNSFFLNHNGDVAWDFGPHEILTLFEDTACRTNLLVSHHFHGSVVAQRDVPM